MTGDARWVEVSPSQFPHEAEGLDPDRTRCGPRTGGRGGGRGPGGDLSAVQPFVTEKALRQLKFADLLPPDLAHATLEAPLADPEAAVEVLRMPIATASR